MCTDEVPCIYKQFRALQLDKVWFAALSLRRERARVRAYKLFFV